MDTFADRWAAALEMNGLENADAAHQLSREYPQQGQSLINTWKRRGKVGSRSIEAVTALLPLTNIEWLQYGRGVPRRVVSPPSQPARPDPGILAAAYHWTLIGLGLHTNRKDLRLTEVTDAALVCNIYGLLAGNDGTLPGGVESSQVRAIFGGQKQGEESAVQGASKIGGEGGRRGKRR